MVAGRASSPSTGSRDAARAAAGSRWSSRASRRSLHTDLIVIDNFTQLLGCWGLDYLAEGDVMFPLRMEELEIFGDRPPVGTDVACRITIHELERHRIRVEAEIVRPDGTVWMRIRDWEDWRFHWPGRYRESFRQPRDYLRRRGAAARRPGRAATSAAKAVWLEPPADMGRPVWRDVLEQTQLGPDGTGRAPGLGGPERAAVAPALGPDRRQGGRPAALARPKAGRRSIRPTWRSSPTNTAGPG